MDQRHKRLLEQGDKLFQDRRSLDTSWQEIALGFYPEMAEFTSTRNLGEDYAAHLTTSYPLIARRTLGDSLSALLRPTNLDTLVPGVWFAITTQDHRREDHAAQLWLESRTKIMRRAMYDPEAKFVRATKEGDHSFATFGQCIVQLGLNRNRNGLLYRSHHLKDVVWCENGEGSIDHVQRRWKPTATQLASVFGNKVSPKVRERLSTDPYCRVNCRHIVIASETYGETDNTGKRYRTPWVSIWIDADNDHVMEETGSYSRIYIIPRWMTLPGSQYGYSPAVMAALPDARLIQAMTLTLLEAGEKFANPPMKITTEVVRSDVSLYPGGLTAVDAEYDEKLGRAIEPIYQPTAGQSLAVGLELNRGTAEIIAKAFYLDSLTLPQMGTRDRVTAFEISQRISEWLRRAAPLFEPMVFEYNAPICEETFDLLMRNGGFGPLEEIPPSLRGSDVQFKFESPIHESIDRKKGEKFLEAKALLIQAAEVEPGSVYTLDFQRALRDAYQGIGVPTPWVRAPEVVEQMTAQGQEQQQMQQALATGIEGTEAVKNIGSAVKDFAGARQQKAAA